jgi:hypothetical protein
MEVSPLLIAGLLLALFAVFTAPRAVRIVPAGPRAQRRTARPLPPHAAART